MKRKASRRRPLARAALALGASLLLAQTAAAADAPLLRPGVFGGRVQNGVRLDFGLGYPLFAPRISYAHRGQWELSVAPVFLFFDFGSYMIGGGGDVGLRVALASGPRAALALTFGTAVDAGAWMDGPHFWRTTFGPLGLAGSFGGERGVFNLAVGFVPRVVQYTNSRWRGHSNVDDGPQAPIAQLSGMLRFGGEFRVSPRTTFGVHVWGEGGTQPDPWAPGTGWVPRGAGGLDLMFAVAAGRALAEP